MCSKGELYSVIECQRLAQRTMLRDDFYIPSTRRELEPLFENSEHIGYVIGAYQRSKLVGFASVLKCNSPYFGFPCDESRSVYSIEDTIVMPDCYGKGIQKLLWSYVLTLLPVNSLVMCTIHPDNIYSMRNALLLHFLPQSRVFCENLPRIVMVHQ